MKHSKETMHQEGLSLFGLPVDCGKCAGYFVPFEAQVLVLVTDRYRTFEPFWNMIRQGIVRFVVTCKCADGKIRFCVHYVRFASLWLSGEEAARVAG